MALSASRRNLQCALPPSKSTVPQVEGAEALVLENVDPSRFSVVMAEASPQHKESNARVEQLLRKGGLHVLGRLMDSVVWGREQHAWRHFARGFP